MKLFWNTLRLTRRNQTEERPIGKSIKNYWWNKGTTMLCTLTTRCTLHCNYCPMFIKSPKYPKYEESTLEEWKRFFIKYPDWASLVYISGGEPSLMPYMAELTNWLVGRGHHVIIFTNLAKPEAFFKIKKSFRFYVFATYHHCDNKERFDKAYQSLKGRFRIDVFEREERVLSYSRYEDLFPKKWFLNENTTYHCPPDAPKTGRIFLGCEKLYSYGNSNNT